MSIKNIAFSAENKKIALGFLPDPFPTSCPIGTLTLSNGDKRHVVKIHTANWSVEKIEALLKDVLILDGPCFDNLTRSLQKEYSPHLNDLYDLTVNSGVKSKIDSVCAYFRNIKNRDERIVLEARRKEEEGKAKRFA